MDNSSPSSKKADTAAKKDYPAGYTPPKGRPTPKRKEREMERGVIRDPNKLSPQLAGQRRKELKKSMSKEEWKEYKRKEREQTRERNRKYQERMDAGDERYLLDRDKGPERKFVRDWVDAHRFFINFFMPAALIMLLTMFITTIAPTVANLISALMMLVILIFIVEGVIVGLRANRATKEHFPHTTATGFGLGFYAFSRASQPRRWRTPKPQVEIGEKL